MAQCQPVPLAEDVAWTLSTHLMAHNHWSAPLPRDPSPLLASAATAYMLYTDTHAGKILAHIKLFNLMKLAKRQS